MAPLIITGMHRSGTSLTASLLQKLGVNVGVQLVPADRHNQKGYFEDIDFLELQRKALQECCDCHDPGWHDWGWTEQETLDASKFDRYTKEALSLITDRRQYAKLWGWKDPRTTLMLNFWQKLLPDAHYLLVYRFPWDVADSILRLQAPIFTKNPDYILKIWKFYNRKLLDFYQSNSDRSVLFAINALDRFPDLIEIMQTKLNLQVAPIDREVLADTFAEHLFHEMPIDHPFISALLQTDRELAELLEELHTFADLASNRQLPAPLPSATSSLLRLHLLVNSSPDQEQKANKKNAIYDQQTIEIMKATLTLTSCCIDVGCHTGEILDQMIEVAPLGKHYAFEPLPNYFAELNKKYGKFSNIYLSDAALSDRAGVTTFTYVTSNPGFSGFRQRLYLRNDQPSIEKIEQIQVSTIPLDQIIPENQKIDLIKIDVEGAELEVLLGAQKILTKWQPIVIFEHGRGAAEYYDTTPNQVYDLLTSCGLLASIMSLFLARLPPLSRSEFIDCFNQGREYYYIAYSQDKNYTFSRPEPLKTAEIINLNLINKLEIAEQEIAALKKRLGL